MTFNSPKIPIVRYACALIALIILLSSAWALSSCASKKGKEESNAFAKFTSGGKKLSVRAPISDSERDVFLFALDPWRSPSDLKGLEPLAKAKVRGDEAKVTLKLDGFDLDELVCKGFAFAMQNEAGDGYDPVSSVYYITNPKEVHKKGKKIDESELSGDIKGLVGTPSELMELGASSTLVTLDLGKLLCGEGGNGVHSFIYNGVTCHVDKDVLDALDREIVGYTKAGISVYLEVVQTKPYDSFGNKLREIAFEGAFSSAIGYALNMSSRDGANMICAALDFITERYSGGEHGRIDSLIIGRTVNKFGMYYADGLPFEESVANYAKVVRVAYNLMLINNPNGAVYVSLGNNWTVTEKGGVSAKEYLTAFTSISENGGDFFWQVCLEANASDSSDSSIWDDPLAKGTDQFVSPANLSVVVKVLSGSAYKCNGYMRNIVLNRFAIGGADQEAQAASYAYAYYTALSSKRVNALIYAHVSDEGAIGTSGLYTASGAKRIAEIFKSVDDKNVGDVSYISNLIGKDWKELYSNGSKNAVRRERFDGEAVSRAGRKDQTIIADFKNGDTFGFAPISSDYLDLRFADKDDSPALYASLDTKSSLDEAGVVTEAVTLKSLKKAGYLVLSTKVEAAGQNARLTVRLKGYDNNGKELLYVASADTQTGVWAETYFDIKSFIRQVDSETLTLAISVKNDGASNDDAALWISRISAEEPDKTDFPFWIIWVVVGLAAAGGLTAFVIWFRKNYTFVRE